MTICQALVGPFPNVPIYKIACVHGIDIGMKGLSTTGRVVGEGGSVNMAYSQFSTP